MLLPMRYFLMILLASCLFSSQAYSEVYRWVDAAGKVHYSDSPHADAEVVHIAPAPTPVTPVEQSAGGTEETKAVDEEDEAEAYQIKILTPEHDEAIRDNAGNVVVFVKVTPSLEPDKGYAFVVYLDGTESKEKQTTPQFTLQNVDRGTHELRVELMDNKNKVLSTASATFHLQRHSVLHKNNTNN
jgi:hypothetical protein